MRVLLSDEAQHDIQKILEYLSEFGDNPPKKFREDFKTFRRQVSAIPHMFNKFRYNPRFRVSVILYDYLVFYEVMDKHIEVYRVLHSKRIKAMPMLEDSDG